MKFSEKLQALGFATYEGYLAGPHWQGFKKRYRESGRPLTCAVCGEKPIQLHHHNYKRLGDELLTDVDPLCRGHHVLVHSMLKEARRFVQDTAWAIGLLRADPATAAPPPKKAKPHKKKRTKAEKRHARLARQEANRARRQAEKEGREASEAVRRQEAQVKEAEARRIRKKKFKAERQRYHYLKSEWGGKAPSPIQGRLGKCKEHVALMRQQIAVWEVLQAEEAERQAQRRARRVAEAAARPEGPKSLPPLQGDAMRIANREKLRAFRERMRGQNAAS